MNKISVKEADIYGGLHPSIYIDNVFVSTLLHEATCDDSYKSLFCSLAIHDICFFGDKYIWSLIDEKRSCNIPILLCPDDQDLFCIIVVAEVVHAENSVTWKRIGVVDMFDWSDAEFDNSGFKKQESWSDDDWEKYGDTMGTLNVNDSEWNEYLEERWEEEYLRRYWNYMHPKLNDDKYIKWSSLPSYTFNVKEYEEVVSYYRENHHHF